MDTELKKSVEQTCRELGMSMTTAFTVFAKKMSSEKRIPFEVSVDPFYSESNRGHLRRAIADAEAGRNMQEHDLIDKMPMHISDVPTASITDVKKSPARVFDLAAEEQNAVYVFNRGSVSGVMLTQGQFEGFVRRIEELEDRLLDAEAARRLADTSIRTYTDAEVHSDRSAVTTP
jgi:DNA-damage-inducible protein J